MATRKKKKKRKIVLFFWFHFEYSGFLTPYLPDTCRRDYKQLRCLFLVDFDFTLCDLCIKLLFYMFFLLYFQDMSCCQNIC